jgi:hypothetical protein
MLLQDNGKSRMVNVPKFYPIGEYVLQVLFSLGSRFHWIRSWRWGTWKRILEAFMELRRRTMLLVAVLSMIICSRSSAIADPYEGYR